MSDIIVVYSDEDEDLLASQWDSTQWISRGRRYENVPVEVVAARRRILQIPAGVQLPPKTIALLLSFDLPPLCSDEPMDIDVEVYVASEPTPNIASFLPSLALPTQKNAYQHLYRRQFKFTHRNYAALGTLRFAHLPANSFLAFLPTNNEPVKEFRDHVEIGLHGQKIFDELFMEREVLGKAVASLNTVRRKGKANINIIDVEEEEEEVE
ncbi:hypothetical protein C8F04DRAFT_1287146 [Mycena alexandri]|uniref:Uncharacterized protein n=1 Tax=Mycena alexandri TaxID=1745969 RepID=A0AAD6TCD6_9AGAR|nr:hypothetical protein C8F04DRAFT_1193449 [Mycena alexandri]KAJ7043112.1 hypothetical protein C8F04DRAFT_1287146 [Mycena alexandri]